MRVPWTLNGRSYSPSDVKVRSFEGPLHLNKDDMHVQCRARQ